MSKSKSKSKSKKFRSKVVAGKQQTLPLPGVTVKRKWRKEWGSPMVAVRLPEPLAKAWRRHVGKRDQAAVLRAAVARACRFNLKTLDKE